MTERERLVELLRPKLDCKSPARCEICKQNRVCEVHKISDYLLENGVIVPPCKEGGTVYLLDGDEIKKVLVTTTICCGDEMRFESVDEKTFDEYEFEDFEVGETVFLSREEAEKALKERLNYERL